MPQIDSIVKPGSLTCVGSGIKGISHLTLEAVDWIRHADVVCYCCPDPATVVWIRQNAKTHRDLGAFYADGRHRLDTYTLMTECMLSLVREGKNVCAVFYGHPGLFVYSTHKACATAKAEGYAVRMLPGISAADCLFADLGFDPSQAGCVMYEATDMLLRRRPLLPDSHVIIWQVGVVGEAQWQVAGHTNRYAGYLIDYLLETYEATHKVFHYQGTQYPMLPSMIQRVELGSVERECLFTTTSTLLLPAAKPRTTDKHLAEILGIFGVRPENPPMAVASPATVAPPSEVSCSMDPGSALADYINLMGTSVDALTAFLRDREQAVAAQSGLTEAERDALLSPDPARIRAAIAEPRSPSADGSRAEVAG